MEVTRSGVNGLLVVSRAVEVNVDVLEPALTRNQRITGNLVWSRTWDLKTRQKPANIVSIDDYYTKDIIQIHTHTHTQACMRYLTIMPRARVGYEMVRLLGYNYLISNKARVE